MQTTEQVLEAPSTSLTTKLGFVIPYDEARPGSIPQTWNMGLGWVHNANDMGLPVDFIGARREYMELVFRDLEQLESDAHLLFTGDLYLPYLMDTATKRERLQRLGKPLLCYSVESVYYSPLRQAWLPKYLDALEVFDCFLTQDERDLSFYESRGAKAHFFPMFADGMTFRPIVPWRERKKAGFFFGKVTTFGVSDEVYFDRRRLAESLKDHRGFVHIQGTIDTAFSPDPLVDLYNQHQISVCLPTNVGGITNRFYEAALCGCAILHYELEDQPLSNSILKPGINCLTYDRQSPADLREKLEFLLEHPDVAGQLALNARADVYRSHTIRRRLEQIQELVSSGGLVRRKL